MTDKVSEYIRETRGWIERTTKDHGFGNLNEFLDYIRGKTVMDLGSGGGGLATDLYGIQNVLVNQKTKVYSVNPRLADPLPDTDPVYDIGFLGYDKLGENVKYSDAARFLKKGREEYKKNAVAARWERLPFPNESIDLILATGSYFFYSETYDEESFKEIMRIVKKGGEFRASLFFNNSHFLERFRVFIERYVSPKYRATINVTKRMREDEDGRIKEYFDGYISIIK
ncbi:MAG: class I SAM-dependent methyltransferase [Candidatus Dojkabacteria bacterium]